MFDDSVQSNDDLFFGEATPLFLKRIPSRIDYVRGVQTYGSDNLYPQRSLEVQKQSYTLKQAIRRLSDFTIGKGFVNADLNGIKVNSDGLGGTTLLTALRSFILDYSSSDIIALHFNFNMLGEICSINVLKSEYCRFGEPDEDNVVREIKYSTNWEGERYKTRRRVKVEAYPVFNPDPVVVREQIEQAGGIKNYRGQILYYTPKAWEYPETTFDAVMDHAQTQGDSGEFSVGITQNAFLGNVAFVYPGKFESDYEKRKMNKFLNSRAGARNAGKVIGIENTTGKDIKASDMFVNLGLPNSDKMFEYTDKNVKNAIRENYSMPMEILGVAPETGMFNQSNIREAFNYFNTITAPRRHRVEELLKVIFSYWWEPLPDLDFTIDPLQYVSDEVEDSHIKTSETVLKIQESIASGATTIDSGKAMLIELFGLTEECATRIIGNPLPPAGTPARPAAPAPGAPAQPGQPGAPVAQTPVINDVLTNLTGRQKQGFQRIIRDYMNDKINTATAKLLLQSGFGLTDQQINQILAEEDTEK